MRALGEYVEYLRENGVRQVDKLPRRQAIVAETAAVAAPIIAAPAAAQPEAGRTAVQGNNAGEDLAAVASEVFSCRKCVLHKTRHKTVPGQGSSAPDILFIGEGPGEDEDLQGLAFVGRAGKLLTRLVERMGYRREEVFIANIVKCRPPGNRRPLPEEIQACRPYLERQIACLRPKVIVLLGGTALAGLITEEAKISRVRGRWMEYQGIPVMPTFHPSYLLRNQSAMWDVWADMQLVLERLGRPVPAKA